MNVNKLNLLWRLRTPLFLACSLILFLSSGPAHAGGKVINATSGGVAIQGYDPVAYFTMGKAVKGTKEFTHEWLDVTWHFANSEHRDMFAADSIKYAPQHGGFCSASVMDGEQNKTDPEAWRIVDGRLYLFYGKSTAARWDPDSPEVVKADEEWLETLNDLTQ